MSEYPLTAGARVRIVIESTVESLDSGDMRLTNGVTITQYDVEQLGLTVLDAGWQPGDIVHDGHDQLVRVDRDGVHCWLRPDGYVTYDDETSLRSMRVIRRAEDS